MLLNQLNRLYHTIRYLKFRQLYYQLYYRIIKLKIPAIKKLKIARWLFSWQGPTRKLPFAIISLTKMRFLNQTHKLSTFKDWNNPDYDKIWLYNLHYFDALDSNQALKNHQLLNALIDKWIGENQAPLGIGWQPYPLSLRIVNWIKWFNRFPPRALELMSLATQARYLYQQIEYHIDANHLFVNAKALIFAGVYFDTSFGQKFLAKGLAILDKELKQQFLSDGAHFELSPMYHAALLWDIADLIYLSQVSGHSELIKRCDCWKKTISKGLNWLELMTHPDGKMSFFNDAAFRIAPSLSEIEQYLAFLKIDKASKINKINYLAESGYCVVPLTNKGKAILDIGRIGPNYQPGHGHADCLSFELSLYNQRVLVNSGTSTYANDDLRHWQRSTKAHNTLTINDENSSEVWSGFRVARRAYPKNIKIDEQLFAISAAHDGYLRLKNPVIPQRCWQFTNNSTMIITDTLKGIYSIAEARFYFHPKVKLKQIKDNEILGSLVQGQNFIISVESYVTLDLINSFWYPYFNVKIPNQCLIIKVKGERLITKIAWG